MAVLRVALLAVTVAGLLVGHRRVAPPIVVAVGVAAAFLTTATSPAAAATALRPLVEPLAFLAVAVPMAVLLDRLGFFDAAAERVAVGRRLRPSLWAFAAVVTTVFNLDAAIVLLTPLYLRIAQRHGLDPLTTAFQPILLASLASSALPVSNLTNLIVAQRLDTGAGDFLVRLGPASLAAVVVGWMAFRRSALVGRAPVIGTGPRDTRALRVGVPVVVALVLGFTVGDALGVAPWMVGAGVVAVLIAIVGEIPVRAVPLGAIVVASGLAILAAAASPHLGLGAMLGGSGAGAEARTFLAGIVGADLLNNLPALLVGLPHLASVGTTWAFLAGVNFGPVLWAGGSLAGLLWLDTVRRFGFAVTPVDYARIGVRVGLPALGVVAVAVLAGGRLLA